MAKLIVTVPGDRDAGIPDAEYVIEIPYDIDDDERDDVRMQFQDAVSDYEGQKCYGRFDDECPECNSIMVDGKCLNRHCENNEEFQKALESSR